MLPGLESAEDKQAIMIDPDYAEDHFNLGVSYAESGMYKEAIEVFKQAIRLGHDDAEAHYNLGFAYGSSGMYKEEIEAYKQAIRINPDFALAHFNLSVAYGESGMNKEAIKQYKILKKLDSELANELFNLLRSNLGDRSDQPKLVTKVEQNADELYAKGYNNDKQGNYKEAMKWYLKAAEQGHAPAQNSLGFMYSKGQGVEKDYKEAAKWCQKAAEQGYAQAQFNLGVMYSKGQGVGKDDSEAVKWYRRAAEQKYARAQNILGLMYSRGHGVKQDYKEAVKLYRMAAEQGYIQAQKNLGVMYSKGQGVEQDNIEAARWYNMATEQENIQAKKYISHKSSLPTIFDNRKKVVSQPSYLPEIAMRTEIIDLFINKDFQELNILLEGYQNSFESDFHNEYKINEAFKSFSLSSHSLEKIFDEWVKAFPDTFPPYLARAEYFHSLGWKSRGSKWAKDTMRNQFDEMSNYFSQAVDDINTALELNPKLFSAYKLLISTATATGESEANKLFIEKALEISPYSFILRFVYMSDLEPRWGGSYRKMKQFAEEAQKYTNVNPKLRILQGLVYCDQGRMEAYNKRYKEAVKLYTKALSFGDFWYFFKERATIYYYYLHQYDKALADINSSISIRPILLDSYLLRAKIYAQLGNLDAAIKDIQTAQKIDPENSEIQDCKNVITQNIENIGYDYYKTQDYVQAHKYLDMAINYNPSSAYSYYLKGNMDYKTGHSTKNRSLLQKAQMNFLKALEINPNHQGAKDDLKQLQKLMKYLGM
jgi:TPR repeat protein